MKIETAVSRISRLDSVECGHANGFLSGISLPAFCIYTSVHIFLPNIQS